MVHQLPVSSPFPLSPAKPSDKKLFDRQFDVQKLFYLFSWDDITLNKESGENLRRFLKGEYKIDWVEVASIEKIENDKTIRVSSGTNFLTLSLNDEKTKATKSYLKINDVPTDEIIASLKNGKLNLYHTSIPFYHYSLNEKSTDQEKMDVKTPVLLGGLGISETELPLLFNLLKEEIPFDKKGDTMLDKEKISLLYRHARIAKALKLSVDELIHALHLNFPQSGLPIKTPDEILQLQKFKNWLKSSPFNVYELCFILKGEESNTVKHSMNSETIVELVIDAQNQNKAFFGKELLAEIEKISKEDSAKIIEQMAKERFLFSWDKVPGSDNEKLIEYLKWKFGVDWVKKATIQKDDGYLFSWDEITGNDSVRLIDFLQQHYNIDWVETAKIEKTDEGKTVRLSFENNYLSLKLNNENTKATLGIDDGRTDEFTVKVKEGKLNIYDDETISAYTAYIKQYFTLSLDDEKNKATLNIGDSITYEFTARTENSEVNIYRKYKIIASAEGYRIDPTDYRLTEDFGSIFSESGASSEVIDKEPEIREKLNEYHPFVISFTALANVRKELYHQLVKFASVDMGSDKFIRSLQATFDKDGHPENPVDLDIFLELSKELERAISLFENLKFESKTVKFITENQVVLGIAYLKNLTIDDLKSMVFYKKLITLNQDAESSVQELLENYQANKAFSPDTEDFKRLADLFQVDVSLIDSLIKSLKLSDVPIQALAYLKEGLDICSLLGINGFSLQKLIDDEDFTRLSAAKDIALGAFSSKYEDEKLRKEKLEPYQDQINVIKRDALCGYIIALEKKLNLKDLNDIYAFFLLDVEMSGCFRTSRLVCAISSLQLYVHRILANLERSESNPDLNILNKVEDLSNFKEEWEWRKNYRVWEANRKVFLYPENYLEPDLRDNKTPIFKELEDELLQQKITKESAESAYKKYISQFAELARLRIAGNYYHEESNIISYIFDEMPGKYYFFGRTQQDPPQYFYRTWDEKIWTPWEKIELGINSNSVSAVIHRGKLYLFWVEIKTKEKTQIVDGTSTEPNFRFDIDILYSCLNENGRWLPLQRLDIYESDDSIPFKSDSRESYENQKYYKCIYSRLYEESILYVYTRNEFGVLQGGRLNFFSNTIYLETHFLDKDYDKIWFLPGTFRNLVLFKDLSSSKSAFVDSFTNYYREPFTELDTVKIRAIPDKTTTNIFDLTVFNPDIDLVRNKPGDQIVTIDNQQYLTQWKHLWIVGVRTTVKLGTSLADKLGETLFTEPLESFLSLDTQKQCEDPIGIKLYFPWYPPYEPNHINFRGAYGEYYRELFFHIPFLIASHLNANQKFEEAKWWYERIFDPTSSELPDKDIEKDRNRNWRYIEFRDLSLPKMKEILTDKAAIKQYKADPFNPHAIARLRLSAYQKGIVMKYIDNLLDWGDSLFAQDTMESINEATMLYVLASDILGKRPVEVGKCKTANDSDRTYEKIGPEIPKEADILIYLDNWILFNKIESLARPVRMSAESGLDSFVHSVFPTLSASQYRMRTYQDVVKEKNIFKQAVLNWEITDSISRHPAFEIVKQSTMVFCVPPNSDLFKYWDTVEDRLFKIRNCMNISGVRRQLALFQPPIDPMLLVRAKAAGLSLEDILSMLEAQLPPYRFSYLIEKARQYTQTVQAFGSMLLSALEKKDVEELTLLRSVHERNILQMTKEIKKKQLQEAQYQYQVIVETKTNVQNRIEYYQGLIDGGLTKWEITQQVSKHSSTGFKISEGIEQSIAGIVYLIAHLLQISVKS